MSRDNLIVNSYKQEQSEPFRLLLLSTNIYNPPLVNIFLYAILFMNRVVCRSICAERLFSIVYILYTHAEYVRG